MYGTSGLLQLHFLPLPPPPNTCSRYDVKKHPKFNSGKWTEKQVLEEFLKSFEAPETTDGKVRNFMSLVVAVVIITRV